MLIRDNGETPDRTEAHSHPTLPHRTSRAARRSAMHRRFVAANGIFIVSISCAEQDTKDAQGESGV